MGEFRIDVFLSVARNLSFTKAANELLISQPAISKHITELERLYGVQLFIRMNNRISLTDDGAKFMEYAERLSQCYRELSAEMADRVGRSCGTLTIGASTTAAQYILPSIISHFKERYPEIEVSLVTGNSEYIEELIANNIANIGVVEGVSHQKDFRYTDLLDDELVLIKSTAWAGDNEIDLEQIKSLPLVLRERGSGTLEVIQTHLKHFAIPILSLNIVMRLGSSEAIKRYILAGRCYAIISVAAIVDELRAGTLEIVDIKELKMERKFSFIEKIGNQDRLAEQFANFAITKSYR